MNNISVFVLIGFLLSSCQPLFAVQSTFFDNPICQPPCWQNITPGITTKAETLAVLSKMISVNQPVRDMNQSGNGYDDQIQFTIYKGRDPYVAGWLYIRNDRVFVISFGYYAPSVFYTPFYTSNVGIRLDHAIQLFGKPENISLIQTSRMGLVTLLNLKKGIAFGFGVDGDSSLDSTSIEPATWIYDITFFDPNQFQIISYSDAVFPGTFNPNNFHPWMGYGSLKDKYWPPMTTPPSQ